MTTAGALDVPKPTYQCVSKEDNTDSDAGYLSLIEKVPSADRCCQLCSVYPGCNYWTWIKEVNGGVWYQRCFLKATSSQKKQNNGTVSGASVSVPPPSTVRSGKRGVAWFNSKSCSDLKLLTNISWLYNWNTQPEQEIITCLTELGIEYVPMIWGGFSSINDINLTIYGNAKRILAFNEPNFRTQSNVLPQAAAQMWPAITTLANERGWLIGSPSPSACGPDTDCYQGTWDPIPWFDDFMSNCTNCQIDFIATHVYTCSIPFLKYYLESFKKYNKPVWLTEFACPAAGAPYEWNMDFMTQAINYLDNQTFIERYAWFGTRIDPSDGWLGPQIDLLYYNTSGLTPLGKLYTNL